MTTPTFNQPKPPGAGGDKIEWLAHLGQLVLIEPKGIQHAVKTANGAADAIEADVAFIDAPGGPQEYRDSLIFSKVLFAQLENEIGGVTLGRLQEYTTQEGRRTVQLGGFLPQDEQTAGAYVVDRNTRRTMGQVAQPAAPQGQAPQGYPQQQAPAYPPQGQPPAQYGQPPAGQPGGYPAGPQYPPQQPPQGYPQQPYGPPQGGPGEPPF